MSKYSIDQSTLNALAIKIQRLSGLNRKLTPEDMALVIDLFMEREIEYYSGVTTVFYNPFIDSIGDSLFYNHKTLTEVDCPNVTTLGAYAFNAAATLSKVNLPSLTYVGNHVFYRCYSLTDVNLPEAITINQNAFRECTSLSSITLPKVQTLGAQVFRGTTTGTSVLKEIDLPVATSIGAYSFYDLPQLTKLILRSNTICTLSGLGFNDKHNLGADGGGIYVSDNLLNGYKETTNWIAVADYIKPLSQLEVSE